MTEPTMELQQRLETGTDERAGGWILTRTGVKLHPLDIRRNDIRVQDIAHALSNLCRFGGHTRVFYSVAQHSVLVSEVVEMLIERGECPQLDSPRAQSDAIRWGLVHDGSEGLGLVDVLRPVKHSPELAGYRAIEKRAELVIADAFGLPAVIPAVVKRADNILLATERRDLMARPPVPWTAAVGIEPLGGVIVPWAPQLAKERFLDRWDQLHAIAVGGV